MEVVGKVKVIGDEQQVSTSFKKRELVVATENQYPQIILIEFVQDKTDLLNGLSVGQDVKVSINLGGREWVNPAGETKYFNTIKGWRVENVNNEPSQNYTNIVESSKMFAPKEQPARQVADSIPDLPF